MNRVSISCKAEIFLLYSIKNGSGAHQASYPMGTGGSFPVGKASGNLKLTIHFHLEPRFMTCEAASSQSRSVFMTWYLIKHKGNFTIVRQTYIQSDEMIKHGLPRSDADITSCELLLNSQTNVRIHSVAAYRASRDRDR
jgi:hypothetical protein